jgi:DNA repair protein RecN (Recombination protein N)
MLNELRITNFAIIDRLELSFNPGLVTFTGETGAGKSIIIDAVEAILGGRVDSSMVRSGSERAIIEGVFSFPKGGQSEITAILEREELLDSTEQLVLSREIRSAGRSIARVNGRSVSVGLLTEIGEYLVDVHGQSEHLSLLNVRQHMRLLDRHANLEEKLAAYQNTYRRLIDVRKELERLVLLQSEAARQADILNYQINEIESARLYPGEEEELKEELTRLANAEELATLIEAALISLDEGLPDSPSITDSLGQVTRNLNTLSRLDTSQKHLDDQAMLIFENITDLSRNLRLYRENVEFNPKRLDQVEERLNLLRSLTRKYGKDIHEILEFAERARGELEMITHSEEKQEELQSEELELLTEIGKKGDEISKLRKAASESLSRSVINELSELQMGGANFQVELNQREDPSGVLVEDGRRLSFDAHGLEQVEFLIAPNPGEGLKPLVKIASGGETSRLMLALKNVLTAADQTPTLIFDEIDQGIGGRVGSIVGQKLWSLSRQHQVLCITHLPQLAAYGEQHYRVHKDIQDGRTITAAVPVEGTERLVELAQMLGSLSEGTRLSAQELLESVTELKKQQLSKNPL